MGNNDNRGINALIAVTLFSIVGAIAFDFIRSESVDFGAIERLWGAVEGRVARAEAAVPPSTEPDAGANARDASPASAAAGPSGVPAIDHPPGEDLPPAPEEAPPPAAPTTEAPKGAPPPLAASAGRGSPRVRPPKPSLRIASTSGPLSRDIIRRIVRAHINEIQYCHEIGLEHDPTLHGSLTVAWTITEGGSTAGGAIKGPGIDTMVDACIVSAIRRWKFPKPEEPMAVVGTVTLSPASDGSRLRGKGTSRR